MSIEFNNFKTEKEANAVLKNMEARASWFVEDSRFSDYVNWPISAMCVYKFEEHLISQYLTYKELESNWTQDEANGFISYLAVSLKNLAGGTVEVQELAEYNLNNEIVEGYGLLYYSKGGERISFGGLTGSVHWRIPQCYQQVDAAIAARRRQDPIFSPFFAKYEITAVFGGKGDFEESYPAIDATTISKLTKMLTSFGYKQREIIPQGASIAFSKETLGGLLGIAVYHDRIQCLVGEIRDVQDLVFELLQDTTEYLFPLNFEIYDNVQKEWLERP